VEGVFRHSPKLAGARATDPKEGKRRHGRRRNALPPFRPTGSAALPDEEDFAQHLDYIHFNAVKHGHVTRAQDWPHSSFRRWVRLGAYPEDWVAKPESEAGGFGER
jgi:hypothetical protein